MQFAAGNGAIKVLTIWLTIGGIAAVSLVAALAGLFTPWLLIGCAIIGILAIFGVLWYPSHYTDIMTGSFDGNAVRATKGVFIRRELFVPMESLRTFEICSTPVQRLFGCCTIVLRFAGGAALLSLLSKQQGEALILALKNYNT